MREKTIPKRHQNYENNKTYKAHAQYIKKRKRKTRTFITFTILGLFLIVLLVILSIESMQTKNKHPALVTSTPVVSSILESEQNDIFQTLKGLAEDNSDYAFIYEHRNEYPSDLLNSLVHNEEMLEFVKEYFDADKDSIGSFSNDELEQNNPLFVQWDKRWGYADYGDNMMAVAGCGPTSLAMAIASLTKNADATPYAVAQFSYENGYYVSGNGTAWTLISEGSEHYGLTARTLPLHKPSLTQALDNGNILILAMGPGNFTSSGHYIVVYDYDENGFYVNDPNSYDRSQKVWPFEEISDEIRNIWALSKE